MHPKEGYKLRSGERVPSVTTITGRFKDSGPLIKWANNMGLQGLDCYSVRDKAADAGTVCHNMCELYINKLPVESALEGIDQETATKAKNAFEQYKVWQKQSKIKIVMTEVQMVSEEYGFGGCFDAIGFVNGKHCLIDFKTSNGLYPDYLYQISAYGNLVEYGEVMATRKPLDIVINGGYHLLKFSKEEGDFSHHFFQDLTEAFIGFKLMVRLYEIDKTMKNRAK